ncbi:MAG: mechanosensitive ion channel family protein [Elusimicrobia bacterium]|nr:mechanosensitive ion channel family protein [Elusimicrobiota bacterium]
MFEHWIASIALFGTSLVIAALLKVFALPRLRRWAEKTSNLYDDILVESFARSLPVWAALGGLAAAAQTAPLSDKNTLVAHKTVTTLFLLSLTFALARLASLAVRQYVRKLRGSEQTTGVVDHLVRALVVLLGGLLILSNLGISITPLLGALGVGSLAVALALQDTLTNLFAGLHIVASETARVGDFIRIDSGQEGAVVDVGWRVTRLRDLGGNEIILPNSKLANAILTNFHRPSPASDVVIPMTAAYGSDLAAVERAALEAAREIQKTAPGPSRANEPVVRFKSLDDKRIDFVVVLRADDYTDRFLMIHSFIKAVHERFKAEGLEFGLPQQVVRLKQ